MSNKEPEVGKIYKFRGSYPGVFKLLVQVLEYPVMEEDHPYDVDETVVKLLCLDGSGDVCLEKLYEFWECFEEATQAEITLYAVYYNV